MKNFKNDAFLFFKTLIQTFLTLGQVYFYFLLFIFSNAIIFICDISRKILKKFIIYKFTKNFLTKKTFEKATFKKIIRIKSFINV